MPAASEAARPAPSRRFRPLGVRLAGWFFGVLFVIVCAAMWIGLGAELRGKFAFRHELTLLGVGAALLVCLHALMRCRIDADETGLLVVNGYRSRHLDWSQVVAVHLPAGAPWATLDLVDGSTVSALGIQGSDGHRARQQVRELRELIERRHPAD